MYYIVYYCCSWPRNWQLWPVNIFQMTVMEYNIIFMPYLLGNKFIIIFKGTRLMYSQLLYLQLAKK